MTLNELSTQKIAALFPVPTTKVPRASFAEQLAALDDRVRDLERGIAAMQARIDVLANR